MDRLVSRLRPALSSSVWSMVFQFLMVLAAVYGAALHFSSVNWAIRWLGYWTICLWIAWQLTVQLRRHFINRRTITQVHSKAVVITGSDSGFGHMMSLRFNQLGFTVYSIVLFPNGDGARRLKLKAAHPDQLHVVGADVTRDEQLNAARDVVINSLRSNGLQLWAIVVNAGIITAGQFEWGSLETHFGKLFDVNVTGSIRTIRAFLPEIRRSRGRVLTMGSVSGRFTPPGMIAYSMTKHAIKSLTDGLRRELAAWGVKVIYLEPDAYKTPMATDQYFIRSIENNWRSAPSSVRHDYGTEYYETVKSFFRWNLTTARQWPEEVVHAAEQAITLVEPQMHYLCCGKHNRLIIWLFDVLPIEWLEIIIKPWSIPGMPKAVKFRSQFQEHDDMAKILDNFEPHHACGGRSI